jgi:4-amino-4-deoxy-L-arabinose transferase-like glycosyltransferase
MIPTNRSVWVAALLALCAFLYFWGLGDIPFYTKGEPREAVELQEIVHNGSWVLPMRNGHELPSKPPLFHWLGSLVALATGHVDELATRLPSALLATLTILAVFWIGAERWGTPAGGVAGFVLATNFEWMRAATTARVDMTLTAFLVAAFLAFWVAASWRTPPRGPLVAFYLAMGFAALGKGPVGIILPGLVAFLYLLARRQLTIARILSFQPFVGGAVAIAIPGIWYALAIATGGDAFVQKQLYAENVGRFFAAESSGAGHEHSPLYLIGGFFTGFAPWSLFVVPLGVYLWQHRTRLEEEGFLYPLLWFFAVLGFYSLSQSKRTVYLLPLYPAAALLLGAWWKRLTEQESLMPVIVVRALQATGFVMASALVVVLGLLLAEGVGAEPLERIRPLLHPKDQSNLPVVRDLIEARFTVLTLWIVALLPVLVIFVTSLGRRRWGLVFASLVAFIASTTSMVNGVFHPAIAWQRTFKPFLEIVRGVLEPGDQLFFYRKTFDYGAIFYAGRRIPRLKKDAAPPLTEGARTYVLVWEKSWEKLPDEEAERLQFLHKSDGTGPKGENRLVFARVSPSTRMRNRRRPRRQPWPRHPSRRRHRPRPIRTEARRLRRAVTER